MSGTAGQGKISANRSVAVAHAGNGKVALVTGGGQGTGKASCRTRTSYVSPNWSSTDAASR
jgi:hypothetical protein